MATHTSGASSWILRTAGWALLAISVVAFVWSLPTIGFHTVAVAGAAVFAVLLILAGNRLDKRTHRS